MNPFAENSKASPLLERIRVGVPSLDLCWSAASPDDWTAELALIGDADLLGNPVADSSMASALRSGLLVRADLFDEPHAICQEIPTPTGSYWHGILHRREPDFGNARYWFHRVGDHSVFGELHAEVSSLACKRGSEWGGGEAVEKLLARDSWDPFLFIELCETANRSGSEGLRGELECMQELEIDLLLRFTYWAALGSRRRSR